MSAVLSLVSFLVSLPKKKKKKKASISPVSGTALGTEDATINMRNTELDVLDVKKLTF